MSSQECSLDEPESTDYGGYESSSYFEYDYGGEEGFPEKDYHDYLSSVAEGPVNPYSGRSEEEIPDYDYFVEYEGGYHDPDYSTYLNDVKSHLGNHFGSGDSESEAGYPEEDYHASGERCHDYSSAAPYTSLHVSGQSVSQVAVREERNHPLNRKRDEFPQHAPEYDYRPSAIQGYDRGKSYYSHKDVLKVTMVGRSSGRKHPVRNNRPSKEAAARPTSNYWQTSTTQTSKTDQSGSVGYMDEKRVLIRRGYHVEKYMFRDAVEHVENDMAREVGYEENNYVLNGCAPARRQPVYSLSTSREAAYESPIGYERGEKCNRQHRQLLEIEERIQRMNWSWESSSSRVTGTPSRNGQVIESGRLATAKAVDGNDRNKSVEPSNCTLAVRLNRFSRLG